MSRLMSDLEGKDLNELLASGKKMLAKIANKNYKSFSKVLDEEDNESEYFKKEIRR